MTARGPVTRIAPYLVGAVGAWRRPRPSTATIEGMAAGEAGPGIRSDAAARTPERRVIR
jgi:hypothetical protein